MLHCLSPNDICNYSWEEGASEATSTDLLVVRDGLQPRRFELLDLPSPESPNARPYIAALSGRVPLLLRIGKCRTRASVVSLPQPDCNIKQCFAECVRVRVRVYM